MTLTLLELVWCAPAGILFVFLSRSSSPATTGFSPWGLVLGPHRHIFFLSCVCVVIGVDLDFPRGDSTVLKSKAPFFYPLSMGPG